MNKGDHLKEEKIMELLETFNSMFGADNGTLEEQGYTNLREIPGHGLCGIQRMLFTYALYCHIDSSGFGPYRFCYPQFFDALDAIEQWDGKDLPPGKWIKCKGVFGDFRNPELPSELEMMRGEQ